MLVLALFYLVIGLWSAQASATYKYVNVCLDTSQQGSRHWIKQRVTNEWIMSSVACKHDVWEQDVSVSAPLQELEWSVGSCVRSNRWLVWARGDVLSRSVGASSFQSNSRGHKQGFSWTLLFSCTETFFAKWYTPWPWMGGVRMFDLLRNPSPQTIIKSASADVKTTLSLKDNTMPVLLMSAGLQETHLWTQLSSKYHFPLDHLFWVYFLYGKKHVWSVLLSE